MYNYFVSHYFKRQIKKYIKKFPSLVYVFEEELEKFNIQTAIFLGDNTYKIRLKIPELKKGKRGSFKLLY